MQDCKLDHLVVAAADLDTGCRYIEELLGVRMEAGGRHESVGTHNRLLRLGDDQYLEVIAIDPDGSPPAGPHFFGLDQPSLQAAIAATPKLITWVARASDIQEAAARPPYDDMEIRDMARGDLRWRMTFPADGNPPYEGAMPLLIEWQTEPIPPQRLPDAGCALKRFEVQSPHVRQVEQLLQDLNIKSVELDHSVQTGFAATLSTPGRGDVLLSSVMPTPGE